MYYNAKGFKEGTNHVSSGVLEKPAYLTTQRLRLHNRVMQTRRTQIFILRNVIACLFNTSINGCDSYTFCYMIHE